MKLKREKIETVLILILALSYLFFLWMGPTLFGNRYS